MSDLLEKTKTLDGNLDREIDTLRNLTAAARTPREETSSLVEETVRETVKRLLEGGSISQEKLQNATETTSEGTHMSRYSTSDGKFVSVDDLPLDENLDPRRDASRSFEERCGDQRAQNQNSSQVSGRVDRSICCSFPRLCA